MYRKFGTSILIVCFGLSNIHLGWAVEVVEVPPVIVQPYEVQELNQQVMDTDRKNRDEEVAIQQLIEQNDQLTRGTLAKQQDAGLAQIDQTMLSYRDALVARDRARIMANGEAAWPGGARYGDLVRLTEDADDMTVHQELISKSDMLYQKLHMLEALKDEMSSLNDKLTNQKISEENQQQATIDGFKKVAGQEQDKIQMLVQRLGDMDQRIAHLDEVIAEKDKQIAELKEHLVFAQNQAAAKDETIRQQQNQIALLQAQSKTTGASPLAPSTMTTALPPIFVNGPGTQPQAAPTVVQAAAAPAAGNAALLEDKDETIKEKQQQVDLLKTELENKIGELNDQGQKDDEIIKEQQHQIAVLKAQAHLPAGSSMQGMGIAASDNDAALLAAKNQIAALQAQAQQLVARDERLKSKEEQLANSARQLRDESATYRDVQNQVMILKNQLKQQDADLRARDEKIHWLNQVLAAAKEKAEYYRLGSQQDQMSMKQVQDQVQNIKNDFRQRSKDYDQFENAMNALKHQVHQLDGQVSKKQAQVDLLTSQDRQDAQMAVDLKTQLKEKDNQITKMRTDVQSILQAQANKEIYRRKAKMQLDDRIQLAKQLIDLQAQETALLDEKGNLEASLNKLFDQHALAIEHRIKGLLVKHAIQTIVVQDRLAELKNALSLNQQEVELLNNELRNKIDQERNEGVLVSQIQDLKTRLLAKEAEISIVSNTAKAGVVGEDSSALQQQLQAQQDRAAQLQEQLDNKTAESYRMTTMMNDYQRKLESKDNSYNQQFGQVLSFKKYKAMMDGQIADLNNRLQEKENQVASIKKQMYDLQQSIASNEQDLQAKDLSVSTVQQKMTEDKIKEYENQINGLQATNVKQAEEVTNLRSELDEARQQLKTPGAPSSDDVEFLKEGFQKAKNQLKQKDQDYIQLKADYDEYTRQFKSQSQEFQNLKDQLLDLQQKLSRTRDDLQYKDLAVTRVKYLSQKREDDLKAQIKDLTQRMNAMEGKTHEKQIEILQAQLRKSDQQVQDLQSQLDQLKPLKSDMKKDTLEQKLSEALDKINEQGRIISILSQKLENLGHPEDLTKDNIQ